jgi:hypothetical protein
LHIFFWFVTFRASESGLDAGHGTGLAKEALLVEGSAKDPANGSKQASSAVRKTGGCR